VISSNRFEVRRRGRVISSAARRAELGFRKPIRLRHKLGCGVEGLLDIRWSFD